jgi:cold shock CspA family protein
MRNQDRAETVTYFIDGTNLCYWQDTTRPTLHVLLELLIALKKEKNRSFYCIFDANTQYKLPPEEREVYQHLLEFKDFFYQITGGKRADDFILELANSYDAPVISNDTYSDPKYAKYSWKERDFTPKRLFMGEVIPLRGDIHLIIAELDLHVWLQDTVHSTFKRFVRIIQPASSRHRGKVKFFNRQEGWGLIAYETDIYFHRAALLESVDEGMEVEFVTGSNDKGICAEQIISGVNKRDGKPLVAGVVENYDEIKTAGSIKVDETGEILFFYKSYIEESVTITLQKGMHVEFTMGTNKNGPCARNIRLAVIDEQKYFNDKIEQLETVLKERENQLKERESQVKEKENLIAQLKKQHEQGIQTANTARNAAEKALRQLQSNLANNDNNRNPENGKQNAANGQHSTNNNNNSNKNQPNNNNNGANGNTNKPVVSNNGNANAENNDTSTNGNAKDKENNNAPATNQKGNEQAGDRKEGTDKKQPHTHPKHGEKQREQVPNNKNEQQNRQQPEKQAHNKQQPHKQQPPVAAKLDNKEQISIAETTETPLPDVETKEQVITILQEPVVTNEASNAALPEIQATEQKNDAAPSDAPTDLVLPLEVEQVLPNPKNDKGKKVAKGKKETEAPKPTNAEATDNNANAEKKHLKTGKEPQHKGKTDKADNSTQPNLLPIAETQQSTAENAPEKTTNRALDTTPETPAPETNTNTKQIITADYFDTPIKRKQWWASLQPQWKKAFNLLVGKGEITDIPEDEYLQQIFSIEKLSFKLAKHKLSFQLTNLSGVQYLSNLNALNISEQAISDLKGTEKLHKLTHLNCSKNKLNSLDGIDLLINIEELICSSNQLSAPAFEHIATRLPRLRSLDCKHNLLNKEEANHLKKHSSIKDLKV